MGIVSDRTRNFPHYLVARVLFISVILGLALGFLARSPADRWPLLALFLGNLLLVASAELWFRVYGASTSLRWLTLSFGVVLDTAVIYYTGGAVNEFVFLYFFSIGAAGLLLGLSGGLWIAFLTEIGYAFLLLQWHSSFVETFVFQLFLFAIYFALTAILSGYVAEKSQAKNRALEDAWRELSQTRLETETILKSLGTGLLVVAKIGDVLYFNPAGRQILGLVNEDGQPLVTDEDVNEKVRDFVQAIEEEGIDKPRTEIEIHLSDGRIRPVGFSVSSLDDETGVRRGKIILFADLTRAKEEERVRWQRERLAAVGELAGNLAHEIRNPLATVDGCVEMLVAENPDMEAREQLARLAIGQSKRLNNILRDFSTFAQLEAPRKIPINISALLRNRQADWVDVRLPQELQVSADERQLEMVVDTVLMALSLWAENGDRIEIRREESNTQREHLQFCLPHKTLPNEVLNSAFQPFSEEWKHRMGLALPTALRAVEGHGGQLKLYSRPEEGIVFELVLDSDEVLKKEKEEANCGI